ncbi:MAG: DUF1176 domain-containing protein [Proteobacteria bacterium]|nr:DUF1176 domain-containing protein [Pseudomonadota bacterium]
MKRLFPILAALILAGGPAAAQEPDHLGTFNDWDVAAYKAPKSKVCFAYSLPKKSEASRKVDRGEVRFIVTNQPGNKVKGEVSTIIGYPFKEGSTVKLTIDDKEFDLYPDGDMAWAGNTDKSIVAAMKAGKNMKLEGVSWKGTETVDTYSLSGITAALKTIDDACK